MTSPKPEGTQRVHASGVVHSMGVTWIQRLTVGLTMMALIATLTVMPHRDSTAPHADAGLLGIDVALIDTGIAPVDGLAGDNVLHGPDLSMESDNPSVAYLDTYGHGTHMAGIIAGNRSDHEGIAPGARLVSLEVAGHDGITTVPQVVAAIDWVVDHRNTDGMNIRVLNLSLGQAGVDDHRGDLLSAAVERAWDAGIFVVVAAGNRGDAPGHVDSPAVDPYVMTGGGADSTTGVDEEAQPVTSWSGATWSGNGWS